MELFDISKDQREENSLATEQPEKASYLNTQANAWVDRILSEPGSFTRPTMLIAKDGKKETEFPASCVAHNQGGLRNDSYHLKNWNIPGDLANFNLDIQIRGSYTFEIEFDAPLTRYASLEIGLAGKTAVCKNNKEEKSYHLFSTNPIDVEERDNSVYKIDLTTEDRSFHVIHNDETDEEGKCW
ncbi:MAG: hypothetical protein AAGA18_12130 [Verrucomicrobiota bacterium]